MSRSVASSIIAAFAWLCLFGFMVEAPLYGETRTWTDRSGKFSIEAELVEVKEGQAVLQKADGKSVAVSLEMLSAADQKLLKRRAQVMVGELELSLPNAMISPPEWLANDPKVPFDLKKFFELPPEHQNAAPLYVEAFSEFEPHLYFHVYGIDPKADPDLAKGISQKIRNKPATDFLYQYWEYEEEPKQKQEPSEDRAREVFSNFQRGITLISEAQKKPRCRFQYDYRWYSVSSLDFSSHTPWEVQRIDSRYALGRGDVTLALDYFDTMLKYSRDLQGGSTASIRLHTRARERYACVREGPDNLANELLSHNSLQVADCDRWAALLGRHVQEQTDCYLDVCCGDYISSRGVIRDLQTGEYLRVLKEELDAQAPRGGHTPFTYLYIVGQMGDTSGLLHHHPAMAELGKPRDERDKGVTEQQKAYYLRLASLEKRDYEKEILALNDCYSRLKALAPLTNRERLEKYPDAVKPLLTTDVAIWLEPAVNESFLESELATQASLNGTLCLVAMRRWQLDRGTPPTDLKASLKAAGINEIPIDPFTDEPLRTAMSDGKLVVYSVGPDGSDEGGRMPYDYDKKQGDLVFQLGR